MTNEFDRKLGERLRALREKLGLTQEVVAKKMGFDSQAIISSVESGNRKIKAQELSRLAKIYFCDITCFLTLDEKESEEILVYWRECPDQSVAKVKEQEFVNFCNYYYDLEKKLSLDHRSSLKPLSYKAEDYSFDKIEEIAEDLSNEMKLGSRPACSLRKILEEKYNIKIFYYDLDVCGSAASAVGKFGYAILINSSEPAWRRNFDLAHELFHVLTWSIFKHEDVHRNDGVKSSVEQWADAFAASLLLPQVEVSREFKNRMQNNLISLVDVVAIAREFGVSTEALMWRLVNLKLLDRSEVKKILQSDSFKKIDKTERTSDYRPAPDISDRYFSLAFKAFTKGLISKNRLAEYLNLNISDVGRKLAEHGYNLEEVYDAEIVAA